MNYYVYYKIEPARLEELRSAIEVLFSEIEKKTGVRGRWMRRRDDATTYMEVYEGVADEKSFEAILENETAGLGLQRRVERFACA